jgi:hypothetical protein
MNKEGLRLLQDFSPGKVKDIEKESPELNH